MTKDWKKEDIKNENYSNVGAFVGEVTFFKVSHTLFSK